VLIFALACCFASQAEAPAAPTTGAEENPVPGKPSAPTQPTIQPRELVPLMNTSVVVERRDGSLVAGLLTAASAKGLTVTLTDGRVIEIAMDDVASVDEKPPATKAAERPPAPSAPGDVAGSSRSLNDAARRAERQRQDDNDAARRAERQRHDDAARLDDDIASLRKKKDDALGGMAWDAVAIGCGAAECVTSVFILWPLAIAGTLAFCAGGVMVGVHAFSYMDASSALAAAEARRNDLGKMQY
jgi:hypothetical protein